jgi:hypothetical protein
VAELESPPPTQTTREGLLAGRFRELHQRINELIFGPADPDAVVLEHHHLLEGQA